MHILVYTFQKYYFYFNKKIYRPDLESKKLIIKHIIKKDSKNEDILKRTNL